MANLGFRFNAHEVEPAGVAQAQLPISGPEGLPVVITASEMTENKDKTGGFLKLDLTVIDGEHKGATGTYRLNLFNQNAKAVEIAYKQLSAICHAVNVFDVADSSQLHNIPFRVVVGLQKDPESAEKGYTEVKGVLYANGSAIGKDGAPAAQQATPAPPQFQQQPAQQTPPAFNQQAPPATNAAPWQQQPAAGNAAPPWGSK